VQPVAALGPEIGAPMHRYNVGEPLERIAVDVLGTVPRSDQGNGYLLIAMDYFTKWPDATPFPIKRLLQWREL
jgi:hypothetical protein